MKKKKNRLGHFYTVSKVKEFFHVKEVWGNDFSYKFCSKERVRKFVEALEELGASVGFEEYEDWQAVYN